MQLVSFLGLTSDRNSLEHVYSGAMLFAMARGSDGFGDERYLAYLPFQVAVGATIAAPAMLNLGDGRQIKLVRFEYLYALYAGPFESEDEAEAYIDRLRAAVAWIALKFRVGAKPATKTVPVKFFSSLSPIASNPNYGFLAGVGWVSADGHYDSENAHVIPDHKRLIRSESGHASLIVGLSDQNWSSTMGEALGYSCIHEVVLDERLMLSIDLYAESRALVIPRTQFLSLVIALETLLPDSEISANAKEILDKLRALTKTARDEHPKSSATWEELNTLLQQVGNLKRQSVGASLRSFVRTVVDAHPSLGDPDELVKKVSEAYTVRSNLVHDGIADEGEVTECITFLADFVPRLLEALFRDSAGD